MFFRKSAKALGLDKVKKRYIFGGCFGFLAILIICIAVAGVILYYQYGK